VTLARSLNDPRGRALSVRLQGELSHAPELPQLRPRPANAPAARPARLARLRPPRLVRDRCGGRARPQALLRLLPSRRPWRRRPRVEDDGDPVRLRPTRSASAHHVALSAAAERAEATPTTDNSRRRAAAPGPGLPGAALVHPRWPSRFRGTVRSPPAPVQSGAGAGEIVTSLERDRVHGRLDLLHDHLGQLCALFAV
jgi:hypothetical protein